MSNKTYWRAILLRYAAQSIERMWPDRAATLREWADEVPVIDGAGIYLAFKGPDGYGFRVPGRCYGALPTIAYPTAEDNAGPRAAAFIIPLKVTAEEKCKMETVYTLDVRL